MNDDKDQEIAKLTAQVHALLAAVLGLGLVIKRDSGLPTGRTMKAYAKFVGYGLATLGWVVACGWAINQPETSAVIMGIVGLGAVPVYWYQRIVEAKRMERVVKFLKSKGVLALVAAVALASANCTRVNAGMVGIKINYSGTYRGVNDLPIQTGYVAFMPGFSTVFEYPVSMQTVVWTHNVNEGNPVNEEITFTNADKMAIAVDVNLSYYLDPVKVPAFYLKFRTDELQQFTNGYMHNVARDEFNVHGGRYHVDQIMGDNAEFIAAVRKGLQDDLEQYGVKIAQFGIIGAPRPPTEVQAAITAANTAMSIAIQKQNELAQSKAEANKSVAAAEGAARAQVAEAEGYAQSMRIRGDADASYNNKVSQSLTPLIVQNQMLSRWDGKYPQVIGGNTLLSLPSGVIK